MKNSFGVDCKLPSQLRSPIIKYDLLKPDHVKLVQDLIASPQCLYVHFAPPCGTSSRARLIQRRGRWNPPIIRTDQHPDGIPGLSGTLKARVEAANQLYAITCDLVTWCIQSNTYFSVENPGRSFMWQTAPFVALSRKTPNLQEVFFHHCRYGSARRKLTKLLHNISEFATLEAFCLNDHEHEPWGQSPDGGWTTAEETAYPWDLCRAIASKVITQISKDGVACTPPVFALQEANLLTLRTATDIQPRKNLPPMVSEFVHIMPHPADRPIPPQARKLSTQYLGGRIASASDPASITIGIHRTPDEFVKEALTIGHPTRLQSFFPDEITEVVHKYISAGPANAALIRTEELKRWVALSGDLQNAEAEIRAGMSDRRREILEGKKLALLKALLSDAGHSDVNLVDDLSAGFDLTGALPESHSFAKRVRPASLSREELRSVADLCRKSMLETTQSSGDLEMDEQLYDATLKEVAKGFLEGPIKPECLPEGATLTRRFGVKQKSKTRPIDDYKASFVNSSVSQSETASVHTVDHIAAMVACTMRQARAANLHMELSAKAWDLADAYKQVPLSEDAFEMDAYLVVYCPKTRGPEVYKQRVLPFGSVASVTAFLRLALALWKVGTKLLGLLWSSYFDDFFSITEAKTARHTDLVVSALFAILGWRLSVDKLVPYDTVCKVLGVTFDLKQSGCGIAYVRNTEDRVSELCESLDKIIQSGHLKRSEGEKLRGRLIFAAGQLFGRFVRNQVKHLSSHVQSGRAKLSAETSHALQGIKDYLQDNVPRKIVGSLSDHVHFYVDASFDEGGYSGIGGVAYSSSGEPLAFFSERLEPTFLDIVRCEGQVTVIQELEMLALLAAVCSWCPVFSNHRIVIFTDSESVRGSFLKTWSHNAQNSRLLAQIFQVEEECLCQLWLERVPSQSNPADLFSREKLLQWNGLSSQSVDCLALWEHRPRLG